MVPSLFGNELENMEYNSTMPLHVFSSLNKRPPVEAIFCLEDLSKTYATVTIKMLIGMIKKGTFDFQIIK